MGIPWVLKKKCIKTNLGKYFNPIPMKELMLQLILRKGTQFLQQVSNEVEEGDSYDVRQNLKTFHREENTDEYCVVFRVEKAMKSCLFNEDTKKLTNGQCQEDHFLFIDWLKMYFLFRCRYLCVMWKQVHKTSSWWQMLRWAVPETLRWLLHWLMCRSDVTNYIIVLVLIHKPYLSVYG